jgi:alpha-L-fucosidase 2
MGHSSATSVNATIDIATTRELLSNLIYSAEILGVDQNEIPKWKDMIEKLPPYLVNDDGALKEWAHPELEDNYDHRHVSHLYPAWPGLEISPEADKMLYDASVKAAELRGRGNGSAHGLAHMALIGARLKDSELVYGNLRYMMSNDYLYSSLFTSHNPGRIYNSDMLCSLPAVIMEMLVFSKPGEIELLPALSEKIPFGSIAGVKCRTFAALEHLEWDFRIKKVGARISSLTDQSIKIRYRNGINSVKVDGLLTESGIINGSYIELQFKAGESKSIEMDMK